LGIKLAKIESLEFDLIKGSAIYAGFETGSTFEYTGTDTGEKSTDKAYDKIEKC
jgi:hypothetical protein